MGRVWQFVEVVSVARLIPSYHAEDTGLTGFGLDHSAWNTVRIDNLSVFGGLPLTFP